MIRTWPAIPALLESGEDDDGDGEMSMVLSELKALAAAAGGAPPALKRRSAREPCLGAMLALPVGVDQNRVPGNLETLETQPGAILPLPTKVAGSA